nr:hypothetical protein Iba_chr15bCG0620 [Ipomoea batatas]
MDDRYIGGLERKSSLSCFHGVRRYSFVFKVLTKVQFENQTHLSETLLLFPKLEITPKTTTRNH